MTAQSLIDRGPLERAGYSVGVEVGPALIRAGVFSSDLALVGKTKFSTKTERGSTGVVTRIEKCIRYAVDECDLDLDEIAAIGIGVPGLVSEESGLVRSAPQLGWQNIPLREQIEDAFSLPVAVANTHNLGTLGIYAQEAKARPSTFAAIFLGPWITGGLIANGRWANLALLANRELAGAAPELNVFAALGRPEFEHFRSRDFRKALRLGSAAVRDYALEIAAKAGEVAASLLNGTAPEMIAIGGGMLDEMREDVLRLVRESAGKKLGALWPQTTSLIASSLGDLAAISGAAVWAARQTSLQPKEAALVF